MDTEAVGIRGWWIKRVRWKKRMVDKRVKRRRDRWMQRVSWKKRLVNAEGQLEEEIGGNRG